MNDLKKYYDSQTPIRDLNTLDINIPNGVAGLDGLGQITAPLAPGSSNHSDLNLDDGTNPHGTTQSDVGLSNVDNTSDANKPVSTAQQNALDLKQNNLVIQSLDLGFTLFSGSTTTIPLPVTFTAPVNGEYLVSFAGTIRQTGTNTQFVLNCNKVANSDARWFGRMGTGGVQGGGTIGFSNLPVTLTAGEIVSFFHTNQNNASELRNFKATLILINEL